MNIVNAGSRYQVYGEDVKTYKELPIATYSVGFNPMMGFWLIKHDDLAINEDTIYGNHARRAEKILKSFAVSERNFGVILSGKKGIGKSLLARMIAEESIKADMPVIIVDTAIPGISNFLASIQQEVTIIFDEFEKTFAETEKGDPQVEMLSLFDGMDNGKKLFVITCNDPRQLNEFLINHPGRFHYHFEITCPSPDEVRAYMTDKLGTGWEEDIEKVVKLSQVTDITFDCLRAIAFDLKQGYPLEETLMDLNINYERNSAYDVTVRLSNGWITTAYYKKIDLYSKDECNISFEKDGIRYWITFSPSDATVADGALAVNPQKIKLTVAYDAFEESMSDEDAEIARRQWMKNTTVESCTLTKVNISMVNKFDNF